MFVHQASGLGEFHDRVFHQAGHRLPYRADIDPPRQDEPAFLC